MGRGRRWGRWLRRERVGEVKHPQGRSPLVCVHNEVDQAHGDGHLRQDVRLFPCCSRSVFYSLPAGAPADMSHPARGRLPALEDPRPTSTAAGSPAAAHSVPAVKGDGGVGLGNGRCVVFGPGNRGHLLGGVALVPKVHVALERRQDAEVGGIQVANQVLEQLLLFRNIIACGWFHPFQNNQQQGQPSQQQQSHATSRSARETTVDELNECWARGAQQKQTQNKTSEQGQAATKKKRFELYSQYPQKRPTAVYSS